MSSDFAQRRRNIHDSIYLGKLEDIMPDSSENFILNEKSTITKRKGYVENTTVEVKRENFSKFVDLIASQFNHGGDKYKLQGFEDREATDVISSIFGGETEFDWVLGTMMKYLFRFKNFQREKDLLKIATYSYILWLKMGAHLKDVHDTDTSK